MTDTLRCKPPARRIKFDRWLFDHDIDNVEAGAMFGVHPMTIGRWRKMFDDPSRRLPATGKIREIEAVTGSVVQLEDWYRPCGVTYVAGPAQQVEAAA